VAYEAATTASARQFLVTLNAMLANGPDVRQMQQA
jgi:hypothetical protein